MTIYNRANISSVKGYTKSSEKDRSSVNALGGEPDSRTDLTRWRLLDERGRQTWHYLRTDEEIKEWPQSIADRHHLGLPLVWLPPS